MVYDTKERRLKNFATQEDRLDDLLQEFKENAGQYKELQGHIIPSVSLGICEAGETLG